MWFGKSWMCASHVDQLPIALCKTASATQRNARCAFGFLRHTRESFSACAVHRHHPLLAIEMPMPPPFAADLSVSSLPTNMHSDWWADHSDREVSRRLTLMIWIGELCFSTGFKYRCQNSPHVRTDLDGDFMAVLTKQSLDTSTNGAYHKSA